jgi:hypothetical protein
MISLRDWQKQRKHECFLIINASSTDKMDSPQPFPIGMCYTYLNHKHLETQIGTHDNLVFCGIRDHTDVYRKRGVSRTKILKTLESNGIHNTVLESAEYFKSLPSYKFVVSPEGNGIDCHRHYEALMAGCIPIVEDNPHIRSVYGNCPILYTYDYSEITSEYLARKYEEMIDKKYDFSRLYLINYPTVVRHEILRNSSFWTGDQIKSSNFNWRIK